MPKRELIEPNEGDKRYIRRNEQGEFTENHELDRKWRVPKEMIGRRLSQEKAKRLLAKFRIRAVPVYQEFIGAKQHLVLALLSHICPSQGSNALARG